jgi:hypothetical protein
MKTITALILALTISYPAWEYSALDETIYSLVTDCNEYSPLTIEFYTLECDL